MSRRRLPHAGGRSFSGELEITGHGNVAGPGVLGLGTRHRVTVSI